MPVNDVLSNIVRACVHLSRWTWARGDFRICKLTWADSVFSTNSEGAVITGYTWTKGSIMQIGTTPWFLWETPVAWREQRKGVCLVRIRAPILFPSHPHLQSMILSNICTGQVYFGKCVSNGRCRGIKAAADCRQQRHATLQLSNDLAPIVFYGSWQLLFSLLSALLIWEPFRFISIYVLQQSTFYR